MGSMIRCTVTGNQMSEAGLDPVVLITAAKAAGWRCIRIASGLTWLSPGQAMPGGAVVANGEVGFFEAREPAANGTRYEKDVEWAWVVRTGSIYADGSRRLPHNLPADDPRKGAQDEEFLYSGARGGIPVGKRWA